MSEHFQQCKPGYVSEFIHEMMWGKTLQCLVKRGVELAADARERYGPDARINLHLSWFGNELVGENGIAQNPNWPYDVPKGHYWPTFLEDCERHLNWLVNKAKELDLQSAVSRPRPGLLTMAFTPSLTSSSRHWNPSLGR